MGDDSERRTADAIGASSDRLGEQLDGLAAELRADAIRRAGIEQRAAASDATEADRQALVELRREDDRAVRRIVSRCALAALLVLSVALLATDADDRSLVLTLGGWMLLPLLAVLLVPRLEHHVRFLAVVWLGVGSIGLVVAVVRDSLSAA